MLTATDSIGQGSTLGTRGWYANEHLDAYLIAPVGSLLVLLLDTGTDADGVGDLVTVAELGPEAVARAAVELPPLPTAAPTVIDPNVPGLPNVTVPPADPSASSVGLPDPAPGFPDLPDLPGMPGMPGMPAPIPVFPDAAMLQSGDLGGVPVADVGIFDLPADHPLTGGWDTDENLPEFSAVRFRHATAATGHEAVYMYGSAEMASSAAAEFRSFVASRDDDLHYTVVSAGEWGPGSTVFEHGSDEVDTYLVAPAGPAVVFVMDIGAEPGSGDLATVTDLGPKAVERARTGITDANQGLPMPSVALPTA